MRTPYNASTIRTLIQRGNLSAARQRRALARLLGLSDTEGEALEHLMHSDGLTPSQLGDLLNLTSGGITALGQRLEATGHVMRRPHPTDRRSSVLQATPRTFASLTRHHARLWADMDRTTDALSPANLRVVGDYLSEIVELSERHARGQSTPDRGPAPGEPSDLWS